MSAYSVENPHDGKMFENYTRYEWGVEVGVVTIFVLRLFIPQEFDMSLSGGDILENFYVLCRILTRPNGSSKYEHRVKILNKTTYQKG